MFFLVWPQWVVRPNASNDPRLFFLLQCGRFSSKAWLPNVLQGALCCLSCALSVCYVFFLSTVGHWLKRVALESRYLSNVSLNLTFSLSSFHFVPYSGPAHFALQVLCLCRPLVPCLCVCPPLLWFLSRSFLPPLPRGRSFMCALVQLAPRCTGASLWVSGCICDGSVALLSCWECGLALLSSRQSVHGNKGY